MSDLPVQVINLCHPIHAFHAINQLLGTLPPAKQHYNKEVLAVYVETTLARGSASLGSISLSLCDLTFFLATLAGNDLV